MYGNLQQNNISDEELIYRIGDRVAGDCKQSNQKLMKNVNVSKESTFKEDYHGKEDLNFGESQFSKNQTQAIIDSSKAFLEMLQKAAEKRMMNELDAEGKNNINEIAEEQPALSEVFKLGNNNLNKNHHK